LEEQTLKLCLAEYHLYDNSLRLEQLPRLSNIDTPFFLAEYVFRLMNFRVRTMVATAEIIDLNEVRRRRQMAAQPEAPVHAVVPGTWVAVWLFVPVWVGNAWPMSR